jgi:hypothetical protein
MHIFSPKEILPMENKKEKAMKNITKQNKNQVALISC